MGIVGVGFKLVIVAMLVLVFGRFIVYFMARYFAGKLSVRFMEAIFFPGNKNFREFEVELSAIKTKIANGYYDEAIELLKIELEKNPRKFNALDLLSDLYIDKKQDFKAGYELLNNYFSSSTKRNEKDIRLLMKLVDLYIAGNAEERAVDLLTNEMKLDYSDSNISTIKIRLDTLQAESINAIV
jgi:tetratricopeptide (TPR) repeat protein